MILFLLITNFFLDRETNIVHVFHADTADWTFQEKRLPKPLFSHGCNLVTLKDGRNGILTVGGFTTEGIPAVIPNTNNVVVVVIFLNLKFIMHLFLRIICIFLI